MNTNWNHNFAECAAIQAQLAEYTENTLSGRQVWDVEKHLAHCADCARMSREMQTTISLLKNTERRDTGDDFMARLHARIDMLEPEIVRAPSLGSILRDGLAALGSVLRSPRIPALSLGVAVTAAALFLIFPRSVPHTAQNANSALKPIPVTQIAAEPLRRNAALAARNPFDDPVAATLEANAEPAEPAEGETSIQ